MQDPLPIIWDSDELGGGVWWLQFTEFAWIKIINEDKTLTKYLLKNWKWPKGGCDWNNCPKY